MHFTTCFSLLVFVTFLELDLVHSSGIGQNCHLDTECEVKNSFCSNSKTCECKEYSIFDADKGVCEPDECKNNVDCDKYPDTHCVNFTCKCIDGYVESERHKNRCIKVAHYGGTCSEPAQCTDINTTCKEDKCECKQGFNRKGDTCSAAHLVKVSYWLLVFISMFWISRK